MWIMAQNNKSIINTDLFQRFAIASKPGEWIITVGNNTADSTPTIIGSFETRKEAEEVLIEIFNYLKDDERCYYVPLSRLIAPETMVHDARTKRRGGS